MLPRGKKREKKKNKEKNKKKYNKRKKKEKKREKETKKAKKANVRRPNPNKPDPVNFPPPFSGREVRQTGNCLPFICPTARRGSVVDGARARGKKKKKRGEYFWRRVDRRVATFLSFSLAGRQAGRHGVSPFRHKGRPCKLSAAAGEDSDRPGQREEGPSDARTQAGGRAAVVQGHSAQEQSRAEHKTGLADRTDRQDRPTTLLLPHPACTRPDRRRSGDIDFSTSFNQTQTEARSPFCIRTSVRRPRYQPASAQHSTAQHTLRPTASQRDRERAGEEESKRRKQEKTHTVRRTSSAHKQPWVTKAPSPRATRGSPGRTQ